MSKPATSYQEQVALLKSRGLSVPDEPFALHVLKHHNNLYRFDEKTLCSLLHHLSVLRNIAAHHSRLWNRSFTFTMQVPRKKPAHLYPNFNITRFSFGNLKERRIYNSLVLLVHSVHVIEPQSSWPLRLIKVLKQLDPALLGEMEVPIDWQSRPLWKALLP